MNNFLGTYEKTYKQKEATFDVDLYKRQMLGVLEKFDKFCDKHNLRYSVGYGTMIGAIRHKGFIPWDDDIDVIMPRPDYDKFIQITQDEDIDNCEVLSVYHSHDCTIRFAKVIDANTTLVETKETKHMIIGSYIDVFPMDGMSEDERVVDRINKYVKRHRGNSTVLQMNPLHHLKEPKILVKWILFKLLFLDKWKEIYKAERRSASTPYETASSVMFYGDGYKYRAAFSPYLFDNLIEVPFENIRVKCFAKYDAYLTSMYGDYMQFPPKEYQVSHHYHLFVDLHRRWTKEELKDAGII